MAPEWLSSTYKRYKADTNSFTSWLTGVAIDLGYKLNTDELNSEQVKPNATKSKASSSAKKSSQAAIKITVWQLLDQAKYLASHPGTLVPLEIVSAAKRALEARRKCRDWYKSTFAGSEETADRAGIEEENLGHEYFIRILETVLDILKPHFAPVESTPSTESSKSTRKANIFELLEVEECSDDDILKLSDLTLSRFTPSKKTPRQKSNPNTESNWKFKAFCTFLDFNDIRQHVMQLWKGYRDGTVDLMVASVVTEVAFHLMEDIERETLYSTVDGKALNPIDVAQVIMEQSCRLRGQPHIVGPGPMWDVAEWLALTVKPQIDQWTTGEEPQSRVLRACYGTYDPSEDRARMSDLKKYCEDCTILAHIIFDTSLTVKLDKFGYQLLIRDKVTVALGELGTKDSNDTTSIWLCFGVQMLLDIHLILRANVTRPCKQMRIVGRISKAIAIDYGKFLNTPPIKALGHEKWGPEDEEDLRGLDFILQNVEDDALAEYKLVVYKSTGVDKSIFETVKDTPFSQNPVLCGLDILGMYLSQQEEGLRSADVWWYIMPMAHLYNALKQNNYLSISWPRMEKLIEIHTPEYIFFGGAPSKLDSCHSKIRLGKGLSADMSTPNARSKNVAKTRPRRDFTSNSGPMSKLLRASILPPKTELITPLKQLFNAQIKSKNNAVSKGFGSLDLLDFVQDSLSKEVAGIKFNYWGLNEECIRILRLLRVEFVDKFKKAGLDGHNRREADSLFHVAEDIIFLGLAEYKAYGESYRSSYLQQAAKILQDSLGKHK